MPKRAAKPKKRPPPRVPPKKRGAPGRKSSRGSSRARASNKDRAPVEAEVIEAELVEEPTALATLDPSPSLRRRVSAQDLLTLVVGTLSPNTRKAYAQDIAAFGSWWGTANPIGDLIAFADPGPARELVLEYQAAICDSLSPATVARRLRALNSVIRKLNFAGYVPWKLDVPVGKIEALKDVRGPSRQNWKKLLRAMERDERWFGVRDHTIAALMGVDNLRASEVCALRRRGEIRHVDGRCEIYVHGKGKKDVWHPIHPTSEAAIEAWLKVRDERMRGRKSRLKNGEPPWLFVSRRDQQLSGKRIWERIVARAKEAGVEGIHPHALRHRAITQKARAWKGPQSALVRWARHADANMTQRYIDEAADEVFQISQLDEVK